MNKKIAIILIVLALLLGLVGFLVYKTLTKPKATPVAVDEEQVVEVIPAADASIIVSAKLSKSKANTVVLSAEGLAGKIASVGYELTYDSEGLIKGVNSGSKPLDVSGKDIFEREVYLGTCSRNVCRPDVGVKKVSVVLEFTDISAKKSQATKDFDLE